MKKLDRLQKTFLLFQIWFMPLYRHDCTWKIYFCNRQQSEFLEVPSFYFKTRKNREYITQINEEDHEEEKEELI